MNTAWIAFGGNLGNVKASFDSACVMLEQHCRILAKSKLYQTPALLPSKNAKPQPDYLNAVLSLETKLDAPTLLAFLHEIEAKHARKRTEHWGARTLDLDLLSYADMIHSEVELMLPHPCLQDRMFVLQPLADIQPHWTHPVTHYSVTAMIEALGEKNKHGFEGILWTNNKKA
ncbi:MAG: 2-amino-4-hydroxy-6-hydroxymethyldihydropteridine diphosphokinase [Ghiorsea sp.]